ncbi:unnamed protein product [Fructobacillus cardui]|nr:unnamed protein product [Fructobacillus cardui]
MQTLVMHYRRTFATFFVAVLEFFFRFYWVFDFTWRADILLGIALLGISCDYRPVDVS